MGDKVSYTTAERPRFFGSGFQAGEAVRVVLRVGDADQVLAQGTANPQGAFNLLAAEALTRLPPGLYTARALGDRRSVATVPIDVAQARPSAEQQLDVSVGTPPAAGWKFVVLDVTFPSGTPPGGAGTSLHPPQIYYTLEGTHRLTAEGKAEDFPRGKVSFAADGAPHFHGPAFPGAAMRFLAVRVVPADAPPLTLPPTFRVLYASEKPFDVMQGVKYRLRVREVSLAPGARTVEGTLVDPRVVYVIEGGALTFRAGDRVITTEAGKAFEPPLNVLRVASNEGTTPVRLLEVELGPEPRVVEVKLEVPVGAPPAAGWKFRVIESTAGATEVVDGPHRHNALVNYMVKGTQELTVGAAKTVSLAGQAAFVGADVEHIHRLTPGSLRISVFVVPADAAVPANLPPNVRILYESEKPVAVRPGVRYKLRVRENFFAPGAGNAFAPSPNPRVFYIIEGTRTRREGGQVFADEAGTILESAVGAPGLNANLGTTPLRLLVVEFFPE